MKKIAISIWIVAAFDYPRAQIILLIVTQSLYFIYIIIVRPYEK
jgi:hypothetical protein